MEINYTTYYTMTDGEPINNFLVHEYHGGNKTACGKDVSGDRWHKYSFYLKSEITCKKCLEKLEKRQSMKTDFQRFRVYGKKGCIGEFYSYGFDVVSPRILFALMKKEKVKILYQCVITEICDDNGSIVYK